VGGELEQREDGELMELVKTGDFRAFDELYSRHAPAIRRFLFSLTWDDDAADDATQEVFCKLFKARAAYEPTGKLSTWLFRTAKNHFISQCRKERSNGQAPIQLYESIRASPKVEPDIHLLEEYRRHSIRRAISQLPPGQRLVFVLSELEGKKYAEISEMLSIPVGTVKSRMFAAVAALRTMLEGEI
jgi:RNA polymerase sigma-70 factor (ECF subfamily)